MIYLVIIAIILYGVFAFDLSNRRNEQLFKLILVIMTLLSAFSYMMGTDIYNYMTAFEYDYRISGIKVNFFEYDRIQPGWALLNIVCYNFFHSFTALKIIHATILNVGFYIFVKKTNAPRFVFLLLYFCLMYYQLDYNILRESLAIGFFLMAIPCLAEKKWVKYYIFAFLAYMFHSAAIVIFILPLLTFIKYKNKNILGVFCLIVLALPFVFAVTSLSDVINQFSVMMGDAGDISEYASIYLDGNEGGDRSPIIITIRLLFILVPLYYVYIRGLYINRIYITLTLIYAVLFAMSTQVGIIHRLCQFFMSVYYVYLSIFIVDFARRIFPQFKYIVVAALLVINLYPMREQFMYTKSGYRKSVYFYPYTSIFNKSDADFRMKYFL